MFKKEEEKNKVGRPKLADSKTKKKSIITLSIALVFAIALVIGGTFSLFGAVNTKKLSGSIELMKNNGKVFFSQTEYCILSVENITTNSATAKWSCSGARVTSKAVITTTGGKVSGNKIGSSVNGKKNFDGLKENTEYVMSFLVKNYSGKRKAGNIKFRTEPFFFTLFSAFEYQWVFDSGNRDMYFSISAGDKADWGFSGPKGGSTIIGGKKRSIRAYNGKTRAVVAFDKPGKYTIYAWPVGNHKEEYKHKIDVEVYPRYNIKCNAKQVKIKKYVTCQTTNSAYFAKWGFSGPKGGSTIIDGKKTKLKDLGGVNKIKVAFDKPGDYKIHCTRFCWKNTKPVKITVIDDTNKNTGDNNPDEQTTEKTPAAGGAVTQTNETPKGTTTTKTTTKKLGKCEINVNGGKTLSYNISCKDGAKFKKGQANISNELKTIKSLKGTITPKLSSFKRGGYVTIIYNNGSKNVKIKSKVVTIDNVSDYQKQCLNSGIKDASITCKKYKYHIINDSTFCRAYAYKGASNTNLAIKCDSNAAPIKVELYEYDGKKYGNLVFRDTKWVRNYGFWSDKAYEQRITKYVSEKKITSGKTYAFRITYMYNDTKDTKNIVSKLDSASVVFKYGDTTLTGLDEQINKRSANDKYGTKEFQNKMTENDKCTVSASNVGKNIKYNISCGKYAYPGSLRIVTDYGSNYKPDSAYAKKINVKYSVNYLGGKTHSNVSTSENGGTIRTLFGTEAKENKASIYGMKEEGTITGVASGKTYNLVLYYGYKNPENKLFARAQIKVRSNSVTVK